MKDYLAVIRFNTVSAIPRDFVENTWAFTGPDDTSAAIADVRDALHAFYIADPGGSNTVGKYLAKSLSRSIAPTINLYHLTSLAVGATLGTPVATSPLDATLPTASTAASLPEEVACCLSFHGDLTGLVERSGLTRPANRHRGRIFLGPLDTDALVQNADTFEGELNPTMRTIIATHADNVVGGTFGVTWCVWSRANAAMYPVVGGFVDNAFDTQRRRGNKPTARTLFPS